MKPPLQVTLLIFTLISICYCTQVTIPTSGQCQAICLKEFTTKKEFFTLTGESFHDIDVTNNTEFSLCKLGCHSADFSELALPAFRRGQIAYHNVIEKGSDAPLTLSPVSDVFLLCVDSATASSYSGKILLSLHNSSLSTTLVHYIEAVRQDRDQENVFWTGWSYSTMVEFTSSSALTNQSIQFRVNSFSQDGIMGQAARSKWYSGSEFEEVGSGSVEMAVEKQMWRDETAAVILKLPKDSLTVCALTLTVHSHTSHEQSIQFSLDRSRGYLLDRLQFDRVYSVRAEPTTASSSALSNPPTVSHHDELRFNVPPCIQMVTDPSMCAPPPVSDIDWRWNASSIQGHTLILTWIYGNGVAEEVTATVPRMVHFDVAIRALPSDDVIGCNQIEAQRRVVTWTHRSVVLYISDDRCNYEVEITVVDARNRRSPTRKAPVSRYEDTRTVLALTERWNVEMFLVLSCLLAILLVAGGLAVCRARDRNEFNTLKREHRQLTKSIVVAQSASTLPRSQCLTVVDGRGRPISSDESNASTTTTHSLRSPPPPIHTYYADEGVYDSLDTPTRSDHSSSERLSTGSFTRANPIYSGANLNGLAAIPIEHLQTTAFGRPANKAWTIANVLDRRDSATYSMKYSSDDSACLRHELSIVSRISTDHPNLHYFHGIAVRDSQVLALLFEPCRGGSLCSFLSSIRSSLFDRSQFTPSPSSSGYDGSSDNSSLDRCQLRIDNLTAHIYRFARQIASGLYFLHAQRCSHGAVSSENVLLLKEFTDPMNLPCDQVCKLTDYDSSSTPDNYSMVTCPSQILAPEVLNGKPHSTHSDMWQFGLLLCELVSLGAASSLTEFCDGSVSEKAIKNYYARLGVGVETAQRIDPGMVSLKQRIPKCLLLEPKKRATAKDIEKELLSIQPQSTYGEHMESVEV